MAPKSLSALQSWSSVGKWTILGTVGCVSISAIVNALLFGNLGPEALQRSLISATVLPILIGMPVFLYMSLRLRGLAITNIRLGLIARTDSLTACLNRGAFTAKVDTILTRPNTQPRGALLMIDADNFKAINDLFGHEAGDEALTIIARAIRATLRAGDLVGRMGGEEFGVYLPRLDTAEAKAAAERIRASVYQADFAPRGLPHRLSVSIGGAVFDQRASFSELFRIADQRLYGAKQAGRNRVTIVDAIDYPGVELQRSHEKGGARRAAFDFLDRTGA